MDPGCTGIAFTLTVIDRTVLAPQLLTAATETVPPDAPGVAVILLLEDEPLHPDGSVQL